MENIISTSIIQEVEQSFLDYSMSVITDRALPSAEDGCKPVVRRLLYTMNDMGLASNKKFVKCATPVARTMETVHPHGDSSIYGALIALSQPWTNRYPLISFHGNNGSRDGDPCAAYRYTECKLSPIAESTLLNIKKDVVDWTPNYSEDMHEPVLLPGKFPNLLCNGTSGIAVGMACSFPPHNFNEIMGAINYAIQHPDCEVDDLLQFVTGPDFPTGGLVINQPELAEAYRTGKGRARIRAEYVIEEKEGHTLIVFTSIPYKVSKEKLLETINDLCEEEKLHGVYQIRDESTNKEGVRFVVELDKTGNVAATVAKLFAHTQLEITYSYNCMGLLTNVTKAGKVQRVPKLLNLKTMIEAYIAHQKDVQQRKSQYEYDRLSAKIHLLEGILIALENIDSVIKIIRESDSDANAKILLMGKYNLSDIQADNVLDINLRKLVKMEKVKLTQQKQELTTEQTYHSNILSDADFASKELHTELSAYQAQFADNRLSTITHIESKKDEEDIVLVEPEDCVVVLTEGGLIKRMPSAGFKPQKANGKGLKTQKDVVASSIKTNTVDSLMIFTDRGVMYRLLVDKIPTGTNTSKGVPVTTLIAMQLDEKPQTIYSIHRDSDAKYVLFVTKNGTVKKTALSEYIATKKSSGIVAIKLREGDSLAAVTLVSDEPLLLVSRMGQVLSTKTEDIGASGRATIGVKGMTLKNGDEILAALPVRDDKDQLALFAKSGNGVRNALSEYPSLGRGSKGVIGYKEELASAVLVNDKDNIFIAGTKTLITISGADIPVSGRGSTGNKMLKDSAIVSATKI